MNRKTHMDLKMRALAYNSSAYLLPGMNNEMPGVGGEIVEWEVMPDNEIVVKTKNCLGTACYRCQFSCPSKVYKYDNLRLSI